MKLNTNSNGYTIVYASVLVVIVAFLLAFVSQVLKPMQDANVLRDTKNQILTSMNIDNLSGEAVDAKYQEVVTDTIFLDKTSDGNVNLDGRKVFQATIDGATKYVLPVKGRGLWGGLWGYISVNEDKTTVYGTYFSHESETAGLGARINERWFQQQFNKKPIFDAEGNVALTVVKQGSAKLETEVDGVTGATLTSKGVAAMVTDGLSLYKDFLTTMNLETPECAGEMPCCGGEEAQCSEGECPEGECQQGECPKMAAGECCGKCKNVEQ